MTKETFNKAEDLLEQISKIENHNREIQKQYNKTQDIELKELLNYCRTVSNALLEIKQLRFKEL